MAGSGTHSSLGRLYANGESGTVAGPLPMWKMEAHEAGEHDCGYKE